MAENYLDTFNLEGVKLPIRDVEGRKLLADFMNSVDVSVSQITQSVESLNGKVDTSVQNLTQEIANANEKIDANDVTISYDENSEMLIFEKGA